MENKTVIFGVACALMLLIGLSFAANAWELDNERCTKSNSEARYYCDAYCDYHSEQECDVVNATYSTNAYTGPIDTCECVCGVERTPTTYADVPCGEELVRYGTASGSDYETGTGYSGESFCCLPALALLAMLGIAFMKE